MPEEYVYGQVIGAELREVGGKRVYVPVTVNPEDLGKYNPPNFGGWLIARPDSHEVFLVQPGYTVRTRVAHE